MHVIFPRTPWPDGFPDVIIHRDLKVRDQHPNFPAAKRGNSGAALALARDLLNDEAIEQIGNLLQGRKIKKSLDPMMRTFAAQPGLFHAAKGQCLR